MTMTCDVSTATSGGDGGGDGGGADGGTRKGNEVNDRVQATVAAATCQRGEVQVVASLHGQQPLKLLLQLLLLLLLGQRPVSAATRSLARRR